MGSSSIDAAQQKRIEDESTDEILVHHEVTNEVVATSESCDEDGILLEGTSKAKEDDCSHQMKAKNGTVLKGESKNSSETLKCCEQIVERRKRAPRLPLRSPIEGYCFLKYQKDISSSNGNTKEKKNSSSSPVPKRSDPVNEASLGKRVQSKKKDSLINPGNDLEQSSKPKKIMKSTVKKADSVSSKMGNERVIGTDTETKDQSSQKEFDSKKRNRVINQKNDSEPSSKLVKTLKSKVKERGPDALKKTSKKIVLDGSYSGSAEKREETRNDDFSEEKDELAVNEETRDEVIYEKHEFVDKENDSDPSSKLRKNLKSVAKAKETIHKEMSGDKGKMKNSDADDADDEGSDWKLSSKLKEIMKSKAKAKKITSASSVDKAKGIHIVDSSGREESENKIMSEKYGFEDKGNDSEPSSKLQKISISKANAKKTPKKIVKEMALIEKGKMIDNGADMEKTSEDKVKGRKSDAAKKKGKKGIVISGSSPLSAQKGKAIHIDDGSAEKDEKKSGRSDADYDGEELVNLRVKVLWPLDKKLYEGTIESFDPLTKKHKVNYDDGDVEILDLREEIWKPFNERPPRAQFFHKQEADLPYPSSHAKEQVKTREKASKRKADSSRKQIAPSSSKRSKTEN